ncbi:MAG: aminotransferase class I/II-fold pyridoxal phosphate-dependent enzyme, partial [Hyphomicrobiaceae bacterium]
LDQLPKIGFDRIVPADGAFYLYVDVSELTGDSVAFADRILQEAGVAMTPGLDFDPSRGRQFIRISYARSTGDIAEGIERLRRWISENA